MIGRLDVAPSSTVLRCGGVVSLVLSALAMTPVRPLGGQEVSRHEPVAATVDYVSGQNLYLGAGIEQGVHVGDTLRIRRDAAGSFIGAVMVLRATRKRSVVTSVGEPLPVDRNDILYLEIVRPPPAEKAPVTSVATPKEPGVGGSGPRTEARPDAGRPAPQISGRMSVDLSALTTTTLPKGDAISPVERRFTTPTSRLRLTAAGLPGGLTFNTNLRASHRQYSGVSITPATSVRLYRASLRKEFDSMPLQVEVGRFYNIHEPFSGYWDGALTRIGGRTLGVGAVLGYEPERSNESFDRERLKYTAFIDYRLAGRAGTWKGNVSFHRAQSRPGLPDRTFVGMSQDVRVSVGWLAHRLELERTPDGGSWEVGRLQLRAGADVAGPLRIHGGFVRSRGYRADGAVDILTDPHDRANVGLSFWGRRGGLTVGASRARDPDGEPSRAYSSSVSLKGLPMAIDLRGSGSYFIRKGVRVLYLSPGLSRSFGRVRSSATYRLYRSESSLNRVLSHSAELSLMFPLVQGLRSMLQAQTGWGENLRSQRIYASIWKSF